MLKTALAGLRSFFSLLLDVPGHLNEVSNTKLLRMHFNQPFLYVFSPDCIGTHIRVLNGGQLPCWTWLFAILTNAARARCLSIASSSWDGQRENGGTSAQNCLPHAVAMIACPAHSSFDGTGTLAFWLDHINRGSLHCGYVGR
jgi:hypothetical protein